MSRFKGRFCLSASVRLCTAPAPGGGNPAQGADIARAGATARCQYAVMSHVPLRPISEEDLPALTDGDSPCADVGPQRVRTEVASPRLHDHGGGLAVVGSLDGSKAADSAGSGIELGPTCESRHPIIGIWWIDAARGQGVGSSAQRSLVDLFFSPHHGKSHRGRHGRRELRRTACAAVTLWGW